MRNTVEPFGEVDNLSGFIHPAFGRSFSFLSNRQLLELSGKICDEVEKSGRRTIVVSESGATPMARLCARILKGRGGRADLIYVKFPRSPVKDISGIVGFYLAGTELGARLPDSRLRIIAGETGFKIDALRKMSRQEIVGRICRRLPETFFSPPETLETTLATVGRPVGGGFHSAMRAALQGTKMAKKLSGPFLFLDEYIDSGTTLLNAYRYLNLFAPVDMKTVSYMLFVDDWKSFVAVAFSLHDNRSREKAFESGVYPFENRLDLIGHYYVQEGAAFRKIFLKELLAGFSGHGRGAAELNAYFKKLSVSLGPLLQRIKRSAKIPDVGAFTDDRHAARYLLALFEEESGRSAVYKEFLWQLFDMYGPIWSPLPNEYHLDFLQAFDDNRARFSRIPDYDGLRETYERLRPAIFSRALKNCLRRKRLCEGTLTKLLKGMP